MTDAASPEEAAIARTIKTAAESGQPLAIRGNGTKLGMLRPVQAAREIDTRSLSGITLYAPKELVISARAGMTVPEIERRLAAEGQHLIAEPPDLSAYETDAYRTEPPTEIPPPAGPAGPLG